MHDPALRDTPRALPPHILKRYVLVARDADTMARSLDHVEERMLQPSWHEIRPTTYPLTTIHRLIKTSVEYWGLGQQRGPSVVLLGVQPVLGSETSKRRCRWRS
jgi:hypothetical protein